MRLRATADVFLGFEPSAIYTALYRSGHLFAFSRALESAPAAENQCSEIQMSLCSLYERMSGGTVTAAEVHLQNLRKHQSTWSRMKTNTACLCCVRRRPEHVLHCGHALCESCVTTFGTDITAQTGLADSWQLQQCPMCGLQMSWDVRIKPPTAGIRILSIDGGGIRGVVPLETLSLLQQLAGSDCPVQELFDLAYGTSIGMYQEGRIIGEANASVGGLLILSLFLQNASVERSSTIFRAFTQMLFGQRRSSDVSVTSGLMRVLKCWLHDGMYDSDLLQKALLAQFGDCDRMFDHHTALTSGTKVAVTACSTKDSSARVFANYNGAGKRSADSGTCTVDHPVAL